MDSRYSMVGYKTNYLISSEYETTYYDELMRKKLLPDRGNELENVT